jgi:hypothetical protein
MASNSRFAGKQRSQKAPAPDTELKLSELLAEEPAIEETATEPTPEAILTPEPEAIEIAAQAAAEPEPIVLEAKAVTRIDADRDAGPQIEFGGWPFNAFDMWNENANALLDFAEELGKAKTLTDIVALQSRFASERYERFLKQSNEFAEATRRLATQAGFSAPQGFVAVFSA